MYHPDNEGRRITAAALLLAMALLLTGCARAPTPWQTGDPVAPPAGCIDYRLRGGQC
jgi:hypothetical protein